jgi:putative polyhydroxyalkanoate system protein
MSKPVTITIPHQLGRAEARRRIEEGFGRLTRQFGGAHANLTQNWAGDRMAFSAQALGQTIDGWLDVEDDNVKLEVVLPGFLGMIADQLKGRVQQEGRLLLEKKKV